VGRTTIIVKEETEAVPLAEVVAQFEACRPSYEQRRAFATLMDRLRRQKLAEAQAIGEYLNSVSR
jgi:hypothetical protein